MTKMFLLEKAQILPVGMSRHNATTYAVIRIFVNIPAEKTLYEKLQKKYLTAKGDLQPLTQPNKPVLYKCSTFQRKVDN